MKARCNMCNQVFKEDFAEDMEFTEFDENGLPKSCCDPCVKIHLGEVINDLKQLCFTNMRNEV